MQQLTKKNSLAIIPARGGSKRIPHKNIKLFFGKPIIAYSILAALQSKCFSTVMVSTDDPKIAYIAKKYGADVPFLRSKKNSNDHSHLAEVALEVLETYRLKFNVYYQKFCCILPTAPFITSSKIREGQKLLEKKKAQAVFPIVKFGTPIQRALQTKNGKVEMVNKKYYASRSQDFNPTYHDAAQFYWERTDALRRQHSFFAKKSYALLIPEMETQDIDNPEDWTLAKHKFKLLQNTQKLT